MLDKSLMFFYIEGVAIVFATWHPFHQNFELLKVPFKEPRTAILLNTSVTFWYEFIFPIGDAFSAIFSVFFSPPVSWTIGIFPYNCAIKSVKPQGSHRDGIRKKSPAVKIWCDKVLIFSLIFRGLYDRKWLLLYHKFKVSISFTN